MGRFSWASYSSGASEEGKGMFIQEQLHGEDVLAPVTRRLYSQGSAGRIGTIAKKIFEGDPGALLRVSSGRASQMGCYK